MSLQASKRDQVSEDFEGNKRSKNTYENRELRLREQTAQIQKKKELLRRRKTSQNVKVPLDHSVIQQMRRDEEAEVLDRAKRRRRQRVARTGRSPSPPIQRERLKRKYQIPEGATLVHYKRVKGPSSKKKAEQLSKAWSEKLNILRGRKEGGIKKWAMRKPTQEDISLRKVRGRTISKKWASRKPTQEDINRFKPSLW